jgi:hypothetical protein
MISITISEKEHNDANLLYVQSSAGELFSGADCSLFTRKTNNRVELNVNCPESYADVVKVEIADKIAEIIAIKYKYEYFKSAVKVAGLSSHEKEILMASLIAADLEEDKKYAFDRVKNSYDVAIDGVFNFRLKPLKKKWSEVVSYIPVCFVNEQLKEFVSFLLENKRKRVYVEGDRVYDSHYRRLKRSSLLDGEDLKITREVLLSNCGEVELCGQIPKEDEYYLKEYYSDKIIFSSRIVE